jgi:mRNA-degrading endonuclease toxin of MazEF toxin-antitoxin module
MKIPEKYQFIEVELGYPFSLLDNSCYCDKNDIWEYKGINIGSEFSLLHKAIVISPKRLNKLPIIIPLTSYKIKGNGRTNLTDDRFIITPKDYHILRSDTVVLVDGIKTIDYRRIVNIYGVHLKKEHQEEIFNKLKNII